MTPKMSASEVGASLLVELGKGAACCNLVHDPTPPPGVSKLVKLVGLSPKAIVKSGRGAEGRTDSAPVARVPLRSSSFTLPW